jgi:hypothetical protein
VKNSVARSSETHVESPLVAVDAAILQPLRYGGEAQLTEGGAERVELTRAVEIGGYVENVQLVPLADNEAQCDGCHKIWLKSQADLVSYDGDRLCERCRAVFWTAAVLLESAITDEDIVIPTLVFARDAAPSKMYKDLTKEDGPIEECTSYTLAQIAMDGLGSSLLGPHQAYMGMDLIEVVDGVPLIQVHPYAVFAEEHPGTRSKHKALR